MTIYLRHGDILVERRPDLVNFGTKNDTMYNGNNLLEELIQEYKDIQEGYKNLNIDFDIENEARKNRLNYRIEWILDNLINVVEVDKKAGRYNI